jgi:uncharacterized membrane protein HdeD (DUF308 family)
MLGCYIEKANLILRSSAVGIGESFLAESFMANSDERLWKVLRVSGVTTVLFGLYFLTLPPAFSSALVESLQKVAPEEQFNVADRSIFHLLWTIGGIQILHGVVVLVCAAKGLKRARTAS